MARLQLNKASLAREQGNLRTYRRFLPSLDLKRQQLTAERTRAARALADLRDEIESFQREVGDKVPMLASGDIELGDLAKIQKVVIGAENVVGTRLPTLERIDVEVKPYALLARPQWVDAVVVLLHRMLELRVRVQVAERRLTLLQAAVDTITQRVNLFDKVLIPNAEANVRRIRIYLSDAEMSAVVRSKIAKKKRAAMEAT